MSVSGLHVHPCARTYTHTHTIHIDGGGEKDKPRLFLFYFKGYGPRRKLNKDIFKDQWYRKKTLNDRLRWFEKTNVFECLAYRE